MGDAAIAAVISLLATLVLIPCLIWLVRAAKRRAGGALVGYALFFGWERMFEGAADRTEQAQDPEWRQQPGAGGPPPA